MLLPEEAHPVQNLAGSGTGHLQSLPKFGVLTLEPFDSFRRHLAAPARSFNRLHPGFCLKSAPAKACQLIAKVPNELLEFIERIHVKMIAFGFQVRSRVR